jgi:hypothetical protein
VSTVSSEAGSRSGQLYRVAFGLPSIRRCSVCSIRICCRIASVQVPTCACLDPATITARMQADVVEPDFDGLDSSADGYGDQACVRRFSHCRMSTDESRQGSLVDVSLVDVSLSWH